MCGGGGGGVCVFRLFGFSIRITAQAQHGQ